MTTEVKSMILSLSLVHRHTFHYPDMPFSALRQSCLDKYLDDPTSAIARATCAAGST